MDALAERIILELNQIDKDNLNKKNATCLLTEFWGGLGDTVGDCKTFVWIFARIGFGYRSNGYRNGILFGIGEISM